MCEDVYAFTNEVPVNEASVETWKVIAGSIACRTKEYCVASPGAVPVVVVPVEITHPRVAPTSQYRPLLSSKTTLDALL